MPEKSAESLKMENASLKAQIETQDTLIAALNKSNEELANKLQFAEEAKLRAESVVQKQIALAEVKAAEAKAKAAKAREAAAVAEREALEAEEHQATQAALAIGAK